MDKVKKISIKYTFKQLGKTFWCWLMVIECFTIFLVLDPSNTSLFLFKKIIVISLPIVLFFVIWVDCYIRNYQLFKEIFSEEELRKKYSGLYSKFLKR